MMCPLRKRRLWAVLVACGTGVLFQVLPSGCRDYTVAQGLTAFDVCSVVNCTGGTFFNFCEPVRIFADCPAPVTTES